MPRGGLTLPDFPGLLKSLVSKWRIVRVKTWTKALIFEEILIHFSWENLHKLTCSNERMQYFCNAPKLNLKSRHSASVYATVRRKGCSNQRWSWLYYNTINFRQQRILYPHYRQFITGKTPDVTVYVPIVTFKYAGVEFKRAVQEGLPALNSRWGKE